MSYQSKTLWISYSGLSDFEKCPRLYYLKNLYTTPVTGRKIQVADPHLTLGNVIHRVTEEVAVLPLEKRGAVPLKSRFDRIWDFFSGKKGGFQNSGQENEFYERGIKMIEKLQDSEILFKECQAPSENFPKVRLFRDQDLVLVGNFDWVEILPEGTFHIIDFKTGKKEEEKDSLQLPIYLILGAYNLPKPVEKTSYWYLEMADRPSEVKLETPQFYVPVIQQKALEIKRAIDNNALNCLSQGNCKLCQPYEKILAGEAEYVGLDRKMRKEMYFVN